MPDLLEPDAPVAPPPVAAPTEEPSPPQTDQGGGFRRMPEWNQVEPTFRAQFPDADMGQVRRHWESASELNDWRYRLRGATEQPLTAVLRHNLDPLAFGLLANRNAGDYMHAQRRMAAGAPDDNDAETIATQERLRELDRQATSTLGGSLWRTAQGLPAEFIAWTYLGKLIPGGQLAAGSSGVSGLLARQGVQGLRGAATMVLNPAWVSHGIANEMDHPERGALQNYGTAATGAAINGAILGQLGAVAEIVPGAAGTGIGRAAYRGSAATGIGLAEQEIADAASTQIARWTGLEGLDTGYGTIGMLVRAINQTPGRHGEAAPTMQDVYSQALTRTMTFAAFAAGHQGGRDVGLPDRFADASRYLQGQGLTRQAAGERLNADPVAVATRQNPNMTSTEAMALADRLPPGPMREYSRALAASLPQPIGPPQPEQTTQPVEPPRETQPESPGVPPGTPEPVTQERSGGETPQVVEPQRRGESPMSPQAADAALNAEQARMQAEGRNSARRPETEQPAVRLPENPGETTTTTLGGRPVTIQRAGDGNAVKIDFDPVPGQASGIGRSLQRGTRDLFSGLADIVGQLRESGTAIVYDTNQRRHGDYTEASGRRRLGYADALKKAGYELVDTSPIEGRPNERQYTWMPKEAIKPPPVVTEAKPPVQVVPKAPASDSARPKPTPEQIKQVVQDAQKSKAADPKEAALREVAVGLGFEDAADPKKATVEQINAGLVHRGFAKQTIDQLVNKAIVARLLGRLKARGTGIADAAKPYETRPVTDPVKEQAAARVAERQANEQRAAAAVENLRALDAELAKAKEANNLDRDEQLVQDIRNNPNLSVRQRSFRTIEKEQGWTRGTASNREKSGNKKLGEVRSIEDRRNEQLAIHRDAHDVLTGEGLSAAQTGGLRRTPDEKAADKAIIDHILTTDPKAIDNVTDAILHDDPKIPVNEARRRAERLAIRNFLERTSPPGSEAKPGVQATEPGAPRQGSIGLAQGNPADSSSAAVPEAGGRVLGASVTAAERAVVPTDPKYAGRDITARASESTSEGPTVVFRPDVTALAKAKAEIERAFLHLPEGEGPLRKPNAETWAKTLDTIAKDPTADARLVAELAAKPRQINLDEGALLLHRKIVLANEHERASLQLIDMIKPGAKADAKTIAEAATREKALRGQNEEVFDVVRRAGTSAGQVLQWFGQLAKRDFSLLSLMRQESIARKRPLNQQEVAELTELSNKIKKLQESLDKSEAALAESGQGSSSPEFGNWETDLLAALKAQQAAKGRINKIEWDKKPWPAKTMDWIKSIRVAELISSPITAGKVGASSVWQLAAPPIREAIGSALRLVPGLRSIAGKSAVEGRGFDLATETAAIKAAGTQGLRDAWQITRTGRSDLDVLYGQPNTSPRSLINFIGDLHAAEKAPAVRGAFERAFRNIEASEQAAGRDVTSPAALYAMRGRAYNESLRAKFQQDGAVITGFNKWVEGMKRSESGLAKGVGHAVDLLAPIRRTPSNIVADAFEHVLGAPIGVGRAAVAHIRGIENLKPEQADSIMRMLKKGTLGLPLLALGYYASQNIGGFYSGRRREDDLKPGETRIGGLIVPNWMTAHHPAFMALQLGATVHRAERAGERGVGLVGAGAHGLAALTEEIPLVREQVEIGRAFEGGFNQRAIGRIAKSFAVPALLNWIATEMDRDRGGNVTHRTPQGIGQTIQTGIPGLRQTVPSGR